MLIKGGLIDWELGNFEPLKRGNGVGVRVLHLGVLGLFGPGWMRCAEDGVS